MNDDILVKLYAVLQSRKANSAEKSYVASLYAQGVDKMAEKILEEAAETIAEARKLDKNSTDKTARTALIAESADLTFHLLVLLAHYDIPPSEILKMLEGRFGIGGHEEKASRPSQKN